MSFARQLARARRVDDPVRYLRDHRRGSGELCAYGLRGAPATVLLRHATTDPATFDEVFCAGVYRPPAEVPFAVRAANGVNVLDVGANVGLFAVFALARWPGSRVTCVEPDPHTFAILEQCAARNAELGAWRLVPGAATTSNDPVGFVAGLEAESHRAVREEVEAGVAGVVDVAGVDVFGLIDGVDLLKLDAEGGEWPILADPRLPAKGPSTIVLEHHGRHCPTLTPRETASELLRSAGYEVFGAGEPVLGVGMLWAWR